MERSVPPSLEGRGWAPLPTAVAPKHRGPFTQDILHILYILVILRKQARKSSEDVQAAGYAQFEKVWAG